MRTRNGGHLPPVAAEGELHSITCTNMQLHITSPQIQAIEKVLIFTFVKWG